MTLDDGFSYKVKREKQQMQQIFLQIMLMCITNRNQEFTAIKRCNKSATC